MNITRSLNYVPCHPQEWRQQARKLIAIHGLSTIAKKLGKTEQEIREMLEEHPEADRRRYMEGVRKCVECNPDFSLESIAALLDVPVEELRQWRTG